LNGHPDHFFLVHFTASDTSLWVMPSFLIFFLTPSSVVSVEVILTGTSGIFAGLSARGMEGGWRQLPI
jgi:hypothetical protein